MIHHAWDFLTVHDIRRLCQASPIFSVYGNLRSQAASLSASLLQTALSRLPFAEPVTTINPTRARTMACILLLCDFSVGGLIRSLGGSYTGDFIDYATLDDTLDILESIPRDDSQPHIHFSHARNLYHLSLIHI